MLWCRFDDIPKRHPKFINYMRTRVKVVDPEMVEKVWAVLAPLRGQQGQKVVAAKCSQLVY